MVSLFVVGLVGGLIAWISLTTGDAQPYPPDGWSRQRIESECNRLQAQLEPHVQRHAGRSFRRPVGLRVVTNRQALDLLIRDFQRRHEQGHISAEKVEEVRQLDETQMVMLGLYRPLGREILILPESLEASLERTGLKEDDIPALLAYVVAHELTHALQDDHVSLLGYETAEAREADWSIIAAFEGHATWVGWRAAEDLVDIGRVRDHIEGQPIPNLFLARFAPQLFGYRYGHRWMDAIYRRDGLEGQWARLAEPPEQFWPFVGAYGFGRAAAERLDRRLRRALHAGGHRRVSDTVRIGAVFGRDFIRELVEQAPASLGQMEAIVYFEGGTDEGSVLAFATESAATGFFRSAGNVLTSGIHDRWRDEQQTGRLRIGHIRGPGSGRSLLLEWIRPGLHEARVLLRSGRHVILYDRLCPVPGLSIQRLYASELERRINLLYAEFGGQGWIKNIRWRETLGEIRDLPPIEIPPD